MIATVAGVTALSLGAVLAAVAVRRGRRSRTMSGFQIQTDFEASPDAVWRELTDLDAYADWNPFIVRAAGQLRRGQSVTIHLRMGGPFPTRLRPRLTEVDAGRELRWLWVALHPRLFAADRYFLLEPHGAGTRFVQGEAWSGLLAPMLNALGMHRQLLGRIRAMSAALEARLAPTGERGPSAP